MLFVGIMKNRRPFAEIVPRRLDYRLPEGMEAVAEYWVEPDTVVLVFETDSNAAITALTSAWDDVFEMTIAPAMTAQDGIALAKEMMAD